MKLVLSLLVLSLAFLANGEKLRYDGYKVHRVTPHTAEHVSMLWDLEKFGVKYWSEPSAIGKSSDVMFPPHLQGDLFSAVKDSGMTVEDFIEDVQSLMDANDKVAPKGARLAFNAYNNLEQINAGLDQFAAENPSIAKVFSIGKSTEGRDLRVLSISKSGETKPAIWIDANIHAREWITSACSLYITNELLNSSSSIHSWTDHFDFYILNVLNPDGFVYSHNTDRMWRKTRQDYGSCKGADANRNFGFHWFEGGSSASPCSDTHAGSAAFSEPEAQAVADFIKTIAGRLVFYLSLHSYSQYILLPYGHNNQKIPQYEQYMTLAREAAAAHAERYGTKFTAGNIVDLLYVASGGSMDYVKGTYNTNLTLTYELRDTGRYGFILPAAQITPSSEELIDGLKVYVERLLNGGIPTPALPSQQMTKPARIPARRQHLRAQVNREADAATFGTAPRRGVSPLSSFRQL